MGTSEIAKQPADPAKLSDKALVALFCANRKEQALATEIWSRYGDTIREALKLRIFGRQSFSPHSVPRRTFLDSCYTRAYLNLFARICRLRWVDSPRGIKAWLRCVAKSAANDEYRWLTRSRSKIIELALVEVAPDEAGGIPEESIESERRPFRTKLLSFYGRAQKIPTPDAGVKAEERRFVLRDALVRYAQISEEAADSARAIRLWCWKEWSLVQVGEYFFGDSLTVTERKRKAKRVEREISHDIDSLRRVLKTDFGIKSAAEI